jgi:hypothetical protein
MSVPGIVQESLEGEGVEARIALGGEDELFVTPTRSLIYRGEGLLRDESIEEFAHEVERLHVSEGRKKTRITLEYAIEGEREFTVPNAAAEKAFGPLVEGVLSARGVLDDDEAVIAAYRFSELTLIVAERRLVKHIGEAALDEDFEEFRYEDVTDLSFETGNVAMQVVLTVDGRSERIKAPSDRGPEVRTRLENALWDYYDVRSNEELKAAIGAAEAEADSAEEGNAEDDPFGSGLDPLGSSDDGVEASAFAEDDGRGVDDAAAAETTAGSGTARPAGEAAAAGEAVAEGVADPDDSAFEEAGFEPASSTDDLAAEVADLRETVERQNQLLVEQQRTIEQLIEELSRGR